MKKSTKATLCSIIIFPGLGHLILKRYKRGLFFLIPCLLSLIFFVKTVMDEVNIIVDKVNKGEISPDIVNLTEIVAASTQQFDMTYLNIAQYIIIACWIFGTIDAYRIGKQLDQASS